MPDFQKRGVNLMRRLVFSNENIEMLMDGLNKAGLGMITDIKKAV